MAKKKTKKEVVNSKDDSKIFAFLATFLSIVGFIIAILVKRDNKYVMFYAKQSLVIFIIALIAGIVNQIFMWIPIIGAIISTVINLIVAIIWILSWVYALSGEEKDIPFVSDYSKKINL
jgi:uncharacterized membrane protein